jgi:hypothetical protein
MLKQLWHSWERFFIQPQIPVNERRVRSFLLLFLSLLTLACILVGLFNILYGTQRNYDIVIWLGALLGILSLLAMHFFDDITGISYLGFAFTLAIMAYQVAVGNGQGAAYLWFYFYPLAAFFLFGCRGGLLWVAASWLIAVSLLFFDWGLYTYPFSVSLRFMISYSFVAILSYGLESSRHHYYQQLLTEKLAVEQALQQVKSLQNLLPMCVSCKKIRDDAGYWHGVESYLSRYTDVEFSHSICTECRLRLYPKLSSNHRAAAQVNERNP